MDHRSPTETLIEGRQEGRQEGLREGRQEGALTTGRMLIARILQSRFGVDEAELEPTLAEVVDEAALDELAHFALHCSDLDAFQTRLG